MADRTILSPIEQARARVAERFEQPYHKRAIMAGEWDADSDGWVESDTSHPCPACNTREYLTDRAENSRGTRWSSYQWVYTSGAEHWRNAMAVALAANPVGAGGIISEIGPVECDDWRDPDHPDVNDMISVAIHGTTEIAIAKVTPSQVRS